MNEFFLTTKEAIATLGIIEWACLAVSGVLSISFGIAMRNAANEFQQKDFECFWFFFFLAMVSLIVGILAAFPFWSYPADGMYIQTLIWIFLFSLLGFTC